MDISAHECSLPCGQGCTQMRRAGSTICNLQAAPKDADCVGARTWTA